MESPSVDMNMKLAYDRTRMAHERTLMAWVRTSTSLICFGFTIYKFFQQVHLTPEAVARKRLLGPREFALLMIITGVFALLVATVQNRIELKRLRAHGAEISGSLLSLVMASLISFLGVIALLGVLFRQ